MNNPDYVIAGGETVKNNQLNFVVGIPSLDTKVRTHAWLYVKSH